jgi:hypothetical protein
MDGADQMNESKHHNQGNEGSERNRVHHETQPYWKRAHHSWFFWVGMVFMFAAITIYVMSDDLSLLPRGRPRQPPSGAVGK